MSKYLEITNDSSITKDVYPYLGEHLKLNGYALVRMYQKDSDMARIEYDLLSFAVIAGRSFSQSFAYHFLEGSGDVNPLPVHTEGVYAKAGVTPYFVLGCILPSAEGGQTRIYDARKAANLLREIDHTLPDVKFLYTSAAYAEEKAEHALIEKYQGTDVLRYRSKGQHNKLIAGTYSEDYVHETVADVLKQSLVLEHAWTVGDVLFVNNNTTLHDRTPFNGRRRMLRVRFDDSNNRSIYY